MKWLLTFLAIMLILCGCKSQEHLDARRYIAMYELNPNSFDDQTTQKYILLERREVQQDISLSETQTGKVKDAFLLKADDIPGVTNFIAMAKNNHEPVIGGVLKITKEYHEKKLKEILSTAQSDRLDQLWLQMRGPVVLLATNLVDIGLSSDQQNRIVTVYTNHFSLIKKPLQEFGRNFIRSSPSDISGHDKKKLMDNLVASSEKAIRIRDQTILGILSSEQKKKLQSAFGKPLPINWNPYEFLHEPFHSGDIMGRDIK